MGKFIISSETEITKENLTAWLNEFTQSNGIQSNLIELDKYYQGKDDLKKANLCQKKRIDNKIHVNLASMIVNNSTNYFIGKPVSYKFKKGFDSAKIENLQKNDKESIENKTLAKDCSKFGIAYELINYDDEKKIYYKRLNPINTCCVKKDTILEETTCFFTFTIIQPLGGQPYKKGFVYTKEIIQEFTETNGTVTFGETKENVLKDFPVIVYKNNDEMTGDYEKVTEMLSAYSRLYSSGFDDFESIANALLIFYNIKLSEEDKKELERSGAIGVQDEDGEREAKAEYIYKKLDISSFKELRNMLREDIFAITNVADFTDENFGGNQSGVAISYKLIGFENLRLDKAAFFKQGLIDRWKLIGKNIKDKYDLEDDDIEEITFYPNIPENVAQDLEYVQLWKQGAITLETMLSKLETVKDVKAEAKALKDEQQEAIKRTKETIQNEEIPLSGNNSRLRV